MQKKQKHFLSDYFTIIIVVVIAFAVRVYVLQDFSVNGVSMLPTLQNGEVVLANDLFFRFSGLTTGEIVVFQPPIPTQIFFIKRVIATQGETISIKNGVVFLNGKVLPEPWEYVDGKSWLDHYNMNPVKVLPDHIFVMGDHRAASYDSRFFGQVNVAAVKGEVWFVLWPISRFGFLQN